MSTLGQDTLSRQVVDGMSTTASWFLVCAIEGCGGSQGEGILGLGEDLEISGFCCFPRLEGGEGPLLARDVELASPHV